MVTNLLTWEGARDACSNEFVFGTEKPTSTDEASSFISIGGSSKLKCQPSTTSGEETAKQWLEKRKLQALKRHQGQHEVPRSIPNNTNIEPQVLTLFLQTAQDQMKSLSLYRKEMFLRGGQILLPRGALER